MFTLFAMISGILAVTSNQSEVAEYRVYRNIIFFAMISGRLVDLERPEFPCWQGFQVLVLWVCQYILGLLLLLLSLLPEAVETLFLPWLVTDLRLQVTKVNFCCNIVISK